MIVSFAVQKGGTGKTSSALVFADGLSRRGRRTLLIDIDPQCSASILAGAALTGRTAFDLLKGTASVNEVLQRSPQGFDVLPASRYLNTLSVVPSQIAAQVQEMSSAYDAIVIDCPPSLGPLAFIGLMSADNIIVPVQADRLSLIALADFANTLTAVNLATQKEIKAHILFTRYMGRTILSRDMAVNIEEVGARLGIRTLPHRIREGISLREAQQNGETLFSYAPVSGVSQDYEAAIDDFMEAIK